MDIISKLLSGRLSIVLSALMEDKGGRLNANTVDIISKTSAREVKHRPKCFNGGTKVVD